MSGIVWIIYIAVIVAIIAGWWMIFTKAGEAGWKAIIPIWNILVLLKIVGREWWWIILMLIPIVGFVIWIIVALDLAKSYRPRYGIRDRSDLLPVHLVADPRLRQRHLQGAGSSQDRLAARAANQETSLDGSPARAVGSPSARRIFGAGRAVGSPRDRIEADARVDLDRRHRQHDRIECGELRDEALERLVQRRIAVHEASDG